LKALESAAWQIAGKMVGDHERETMELQRAKSTIARHNSTGGGYYKAVQQAKSVLHAKRRTKAKQNKNTRYEQRVQESKQRAAADAAALLMPSALKK
jgi:hypothetical protein